ncbi:nucleotide sugar dehydrogenase [Paenibacillus flagellatus]|uniref:UDP-N-acetyl-D-mannosamine dehydrogenase n=1 Tax=Paenibacillus flagellatus TaxID=2211139 RepID=A0A2V5KG32_9BACL|nr:nucleotide sugar dehydrogenase [Paenibacillus flagellatus]PYI57193.1 UDP-N-acetyl-D-mannosamine dehydrogenase [Paenibacillus flagellatus]
MFKKICVIGLGYIGLPSSLMFAKSGFEVVGVDTNEYIVQSLNNGNPHIEEKDLLEIFAEVRSHHSFRATTSPENADAFMIAVPTPVNADHSANLDYIVAATKSILPFLKAGDTVIIESTIPPGTTVEVVGKLIGNSGWHVGEEIYLAHCPERVLPGRIFRELVENNRIIGGFNIKSAQKAAELYRPFVQGEITLTSCASAEMAKLMENTFRDVNIALANELARISASVGVDALEVIQLANKHPRVNLHSPGPGVGGHCIAVDPYFIIEKAPNESKLMATARDINNRMPEYVVQQVEKLVPPYQGHPVAVFGLTYKGNVDDIRESPAIEVVNLLIQKGYIVKTHDPHVQPDHCPFRLHAPEEALEDAHCLIVLADHNEFRLIDDTWLVGMRTPTILDTKKCLEFGENSKVFHYHFGNLHVLKNREPATVY